MPWQQIKINYLILTFTYLKKKNFTCIFGGKLELELFWRTDNFRILIHTVLHHCRILFLIFKN